MEGTDIFWNRNICTFADKIQDKARRIVATPENTTEQIERIRSIAIGAKAMLGLPVDEFF